MHPAAWLTTHATLRTPYTTFACLEGCGFCCTYPPELDPETARRLHESVGLDRVGVDGEGRAYIPLQGGCGACLLLADRRCTDHPNRPTHCRLFPFHVYFGRTVEVYADRVCPGLDAPADHAAPLPDALARSVASVPTAVLDRHRREALATHAEFERRARARGAWGDVDAARGRALEEVAVTEPAWSAALARFETDDDSLAPTFVVPTSPFPWRLWRLSADGSFERVGYEEDGTTEELGRLDVPARPAELSAPVRETLARLVGFECFVGCAFDRVDASGYAAGVETATRELVNELAAGLTLSAYLLEGEGLPSDARHLAAVFEPEFYELATIGAWL